jgi:hypothetical protein
MKKKSTHTRIITIVIITIFIVLSIALYIHVKRNILKQDLLDFSFLCKSEFESAIDEVKSMKPTNYQATSIGNAFGSFFKNSKWSSVRTKNKMLLVEFQGNTTKPIYLTPGKSIMIKSGSELIVRFIKKGNRFDLHIIAGKPVINAKGCDQNELAYAMNQASLAEGKTIILANHTYGRILDTIYYQ